MTLTDLIQHSDVLSAAISVAGEAFKDDDLIRLSSERDSLHALASHRRPTSDAEAKFLQFRIAEYGEFLSEVPTHEIDRLNAIDAVRRISDALAEYSNEQERGQEAD